jgi:hypothetical protein
MDSFVPVLRQAVFWVTSVRTQKFLWSLFILAVAAATYLSYKALPMRNEGASLRIDYYGILAPTTIQVDGGHCVHQDNFVAESTMVTRYACGVPLGSRRLSFRCQDERLPEIWMILDLPPAQEHYVVFDNACSRSADEILRENSRNRGAATVWGKPGS